MARLQDERNVWLCTVRADGRPHLVPIWFWFDGHRFWLCTGADSAKVGNLRGNRKVSIGLEDGDRPVVAEGTAIVRERPFPAAVVRGFGDKFDWDLERTDDPDGPFDALIEIPVDRWLMGGPDA